MCMVIKENLNVELFNEYKLMYELQGYYIDIDNKDMCCIYDDKDKPVAIFTYYKESNYVWLTYFEVFEKKKGNGKIIIKELLMYLKNIYGFLPINVNTDEKVVGFWIKCGFNPISTKNLLQYIW